MNVAIVRNAHKYVGRVPTHIVTVMVRRNLTVHRPTNQPIMVRPFSSVKVSMLRAFHRHTDHLVRMMPTTVPMVLAFSRVTITIVSSPLILEERVSVLVIDRNSVDVGPMPHVAVQIVRFLQPHRNAKVGPMTFTVLMRPTHVTKLQYHH